MYFLSCSHVHGNDLTLVDIPQSRGPSRNRTMTASPTTPAATATTVSAPELIYQAGCSGGRFPRNRIVTKPKTNPPMCAKNAVPPPDCGWTTEKPPSTSCSRNQKPRNQIAGISRSRTKKKMNAVSTLAFGGIPKYAPSTPAIAPDAPTFGTLAPAASEKASVTTVCEAIAASPAAM